MNPPILIRDYRFSDLDALIALFHDSIRRVASRDYTAAQIMAWAPDTVDRDAWAAKRASRPTWVAEIENVVVGFTDLEPDGHLDFMYVHPDYQGIGVATALLAKVEAEARALAISRFFAEVSITARPFFERRGFRVMAPQTVAIRGETLTNYRMEKSLVSLA